MNRRFWYVLGIVALLLGIVAMIFSDQLFGNRYSWQLDFKRTSKDPYGLFVLDKLLSQEHSIQSLRQPIHLDLPVDSTDQPALYLGIGNTIYFDSLDLNRFIDFVSAGNNALLVASSPSFVLLDSLHARACPDSSFFGLPAVSDSSVIFSTKGEENAHSFTFRSRRYYELIDWPYFREGSICSELWAEIVELGMIEPDYINYISLPIGKGMLYVHTSPFAFSNLSMKRETGLTYIQDVLGPTLTDTIYWDEYSMTAESINRPFQTGRRQYASSPLQYVLQQPPLAWAWYLLLAAAAVFLIFRTRRRQRIIPVLEPNRNTSLEFLGTIGRLHFQRSDHKKLALEDMRLFRQYVRNRYRLSARKLDEAFVEQLSQQAQVPPEVIKKIVLLNTNIETSSFVSENTLIEFHRQIESFYQQCQ
jgi:hypothetical protein